jgi:hypothetical protein
MRSDIDARSMSRRRVTIDVVRLCGSRPLHLEDTASLVKPLSKRGLMTRDTFTPNEAPVDMSPVVSFTAATQQTPDAPRWIDGNPAGAIELTDAELRDALQAKPICSEYASISTTWCDNPKVC